MPKRATGTLDAWDVTTIAGRAGAAIMRGCWDRARGMWDGRVLGRCRRHTHLTETLSGGTFPSRAHASEPQGRVSLREGYELSKSRSRPLSDQLTARVEPTDTLHARPQQLPDSRVSMWLGSRKRQTKRPQPSSSGYLDVRLGDGDGETSTTQPQAWSATPSLAVGRWARLTANAFAGCSGNQRRRMCRGPEGW